MSGAHRARFAPRRGHARRAPRGDGGRREIARKRSRTLPPPHFSVSFIPSTTPNGGIGVLRACSTQKFWAVCQAGKGQSAGGASHCFTATLPARGDCSWGTKCLGELDCLMHCHPTINMGSFRNNYGHRNVWWDPYHESPEKWIKRTLQRAGPMMNRATLDDLLSHRLSLDDLAPFRTVDGVGFEPGAVGRPFNYPDSWSHDVGGALSLEECCLCAGDRISIMYDFCRRDTFVFKVL
jgi:hypothetical protein